MPWKLDSIEVLFEVIAMKQFKNILLLEPVNENLLALAKNLLQSHQSKMTLMSIAPELEEPIVTTEDGRAVDLQSLIKDEFQSRLNNKIQRLNKDEFRVESVVVDEGQAYLQVIRQVQKEGHDLVMMIADGVNRVRDQLFGTLSMHLMRKCPCEVWIVKPSRDRLKNVFAAVDPDPTNSDRDRLNVQILKRSMAIAKNNNADLHVVHSWNSIGSGLDLGRRWMNRQEVRLHTEKLAESHRRRLGKLLEDHCDGSEIVHMVQGNPGTVIPETVKAVKGDLLVMGTVCRTGIPGFFVGNTAESILSQVDCSVLTIKPDGFVSPVAFDEPALVETCV